MQSYALNGRLSALELDPGESLTLIDSPSGQRWTLELLAAGVASPQRGPLPYASDREGITQYRFQATFRLNGVELNLTRSIPSQDNFRDPPCVQGLNLWLDATGDIGEYLGTHGPSRRCFPKKACRIAIWPAGQRICPQRLHPWCPLPSGSLRVEDCYRGEDVWMGPYDGVECHGGLDINHPAGTPLWTPLALHEQGNFQRLGVEGANNNRWRGWHHWPDGESWFLQSHHHSRLLVEEGTPLDAGVQYAEAAGVLNGCHEHSHFVFGIRHADGQEVLIDPWLLFRQMYLDLETAFRRA